MLPKAVTQALACETAKRSQGILDTNQQVVTGITIYRKDLNKVVVPQDCCTHCGNKRNSERKDCPAKYCFRDGKKINPQSAGGKKNTKKDDTDSKEETSHGIGENCFRLEA
jgi:hypothetical protein